MCKRKKNIWLENTGFFIHTFYVNETFLAHVYSRQYRYPTVDNR